MIPDTDNFPAEKDHDYTRIVGAVAWPAERAGFIVVVGEHRYEKIGGHPRLDVLDEGQESRLPELIETCQALRRYYNPERFFADTRHLAAMQIVSTRNETWPFPLILTGAFLCRMDRPLAYCLPLVDDLIQMGRLVYPKAARIHGEILTAPHNEDPGKLKLADYPGIAALAFAVLELEQSRRDPHARKRPTEADSNWSPL